MLRPSSLWLGLFSAAAFWLFLCLGRLVARSVGFYRCLFLALFSNETDYLPTELNSQFVLRHTFTSCLQYWCGDFFVPNISHQLKQSQLASIHKTSLCDGPRPVLLQMFGIEKRVSIFDCVTAIAA